MLIILNSLFDWVKDFDLEWFIDSVGNICGWVLLGVFFVVLK